MKEIDYWLFNTDETEPEGEGKHEAMLKEQVVAAWGYCKGLGAEVTLNRPNPGDVVYFYRAGFGFVARALVNEIFAAPRQSIFGTEGEYSRPVEDLKVLPESAPVTVAEIKEEIGYQIPNRQIMVRIKNDHAIAYLERRFQRIKKNESRDRKAVSSTSGAFFQPDSEVRKRVEKAAVKFVTQIYEKKHWKVKTVENEYVGYDLHCTLGALVDCVEVKGTSGTAVQFLLTINELNKAKTDNRFVLYVVSNALKKPSAKKYSGKQLLEQFDFQPTQFRVKPKN